MPRPDLPHLQGADRVGLARQAIAEYAADVLILDDGFQHRRLARDLDMVLIDATLPFGYGHVLPRGLLREPLTSLSRADWLVIHRADLVAPGELQAIQQTIAHWAPHVPSSCTRQAAEVLVNTQHHQQPLEALRSGRWYGFAAIGNPRNFQIALEQLGCELVGFQSFRDHHPYTAEDLRRVQQAAKSAGATQLVCTGKDLVKIGAAAIDGLPLWACRHRCNSGQVKPSWRKVRQVADSVHVFT